MSAPRLQGKVAIMAGSAGGIGAAAARRFAEADAHLLLTDADQIGAQRLADELGDRASARAHDVTGDTA